MSDNKRIFDQLDRVEVRLDSIDKHMAVYNKELEYHVIRTDELQNTVINIAEKMDPIEKHVEQVKGAGKLIALLALIATILATVLVWK